MSLFHKKPAPLPPTPEEQILSYSWRDVDRPSVFAPIDIEGAERRITARLEFANKYYKFQGTPRR